MVVAQAVPVLTDNYAWLLREPDSGAVAVVDPPELGPVEAAIGAAGGRLDLILLTHHHGDHIAAADALRAKTGAKIAGHARDAARLPALDFALREGDEIAVGGAPARVIDTPGHTVGHIAYFFPHGAVLICGDTLFSLGCGRLMEGTAAQMFESLAKFAVLPPETLVCCGHEYTESNARFALHADPDNAALASYAARVRALRAEGKPTVPSRLSDELACNPFLRAPDSATLGSLRARKDRF